MGATQSSDVSFVPKVWSDHINAYFDRKMGLGQLALVDKTLTAEPGETANFPYYKKIGDAQEPLETEGLEVEALQDDAFSVTVKEVGKAVGWKKKAKRKSAASEGSQESEAQRQIAQVLAEKVDKDIISTINAPGASVSGFIATLNTQTGNVRDLLKSKITGFGDKSDQAVAVAMHSLDFMSIFADNTAGFLKADATDPLFGAPGFMGRLLGMAIFVLDTMPEVSGGIAGKKAYQHFIFKANAFGIYMAEEMMVEKDRDILHREDVVAATMWYGTLSLHAKVSADDKRIIKGAFVTELSA